MSFGVYKEKIKTDIFEYKKQENRFTNKDNKISNRASKDLLWTNEYQNCLSANVCVPHR